MGESHTSPFVHHMTTTNKASNGKFSVKEGYNILKVIGNGVITGSTELWEMIWHRGEVLPRIRIFLWKLMHRGLPLAMVLHRRFSSHNPLCLTCGGQDEDVLHLAHLCPFSRACFLAGPLGLKKEELNGNFAQLLQEISDKLDDDQWLVYVNSLWALWRCRNDCAYSGKMPDFQLFMKYLNSANRESRTGAARRFCAMTGRAQPSSLAEFQNDYVCFLDGSWMDGWNGGIGVVVWFKEELILYK